VAPPAGEPAAATSAVNWKAILIIVLVIAVLGWLLFGNNANNAQTGMAGAGANPHATGDTANPHGGMDSGMGMEDVTSQIEGSKQSLEQNPLDTKALATLYQMYGMIGRQSQLTPYVERALETLDEQKDSLGPEKVDEILRGIVTAALGGNDVEGGLMALQRYAEIDPENIQTLAMLGNLNYDLGNQTDAIEWYDKYLEAADPAADGEIYWNVRTDRATMFLQRYEADGNEADLQTALDELTAVTMEQPGHWSAWFNLGQTQVQAGANQQAEAAFEQAKALADGPMQVWQVEVELAKLRGEEPPPMPGNEGNPHGGMDMGSGGAANPHGGGTGSAEGMPNPHGGMGGE